MDPICTRLTLEVLASGDIQVIVIVLFTAGPSPGRNRIMTGIHLSQSLLVS